MRKSSTISSVGTVHTYRYGTATVVSFDAPWRREIYRPSDVPANEPWNREIPERCMATGPGDISPRHNKSTYGPGAGYDRKCSCCYLGITHSEDKHRADVASASDQGMRFENR
jgi:hypothetical protein